MSFLKEIITKLESLPDSERIIERIMALVDGDIEKDIDVSVMQEITKIIEEETGVSADEGSAIGTVAIDPNDPNPELVVGGESEEASDMPGDDIWDFFSSDTPDTEEEETQQQDADTDSTEIPVQLVVDTDRNPADFLSVDVSEAETELSHIEDSDTEQTDGDEAPSAETEASSDEEEQPVSLDEPTEDEEDKLFKQAIYLIKKMLDDKGYNYTEAKRAEDVYVIGLKVRYDYCRLNADIFVEKDPLVCFIRINLPIACDPVYYPVLSEHLAKLNRKSSRYGTYAIDFDDGSVECRFRLRYDDGLGIKAFQKMLFFSLGDADDEYPEISRISAGKLKRDKREEAVKKAKALIADIEGE